MAHSCLETTRGVLISVTKKEDIQNQVKSDRTMHEVKLKDMSLQQSQRNVNTL